MSQTAHLPVDELIQKRHEPAPPGGVESPSRAAGGFPTLGGGMRVGSRTDVSRRDASSSALRGASEGGC